jgi:hypothetical protein
MQYTCPSIVATLVLAGTIHAQPVQWTVAAGGNGHWYELNPDLKQWATAREYALELGGDLASISSVDENDFIHNLVPHTAWIGATDEAEEGDWHWSNGDTWDYTNWGSGEPNNNDPTYGEDYAYMVGYDHPNGTDFWYDGSIITADIASVIEWDQDPRIKQWRIEDGGNGHWYEAVAAPDGISWFDAAFSARYSGGYLATLTSAEEDQFVSFTVADPEYLWNWDGGVARGPYFGGYRTSDDCDLSTMNWVTDEPWAYARWHSGNPNEDCTSGIQFWGYEARTWQDNHDDDPTLANGYIIEYTVLPGSALGACCLDGLCITTASADCEGHGGTWGGADSSCADFSCPISCSGDTDGNGVVDIEDLLNMIGSWGACP